jgi:hypothetical protein
MAESFLPEPWQDLAPMRAWLWMPHGFVTDVSKLNAARQAFSAAGAFLTERLGRAPQATQSRNPQV